MGASRDFLASMVRTHEKLKSTRRTTDTLERDCRIPSTNGVFIMNQAKTLALMAALAASAALGPHVGHAQAARSADTAAPPATSSSAKLSHADREALKDMAQANLAEVEAGKMALEKTQDAQVKQFAQMMVDDHSTGLKEVQQVADAKGVKLPTEPAMSQKAEAKALAKLSGADFDRRYMAKAGVADHRKVHDKLEKVSKNAKDADVKDLAAKLLPVVDRHLENAQGMDHGTSMSKATSTSTSKPRAQ